MSSGTVRTSVDNGIHHIFKDFIAAYKVTCKSDKTTHNTTSRAVNKYITLYHNSTFKSSYTTILFKHLD